MSCYNTQWGPEAVENKLGKVICGVTMARELFARYEMCDAEVEHRSVREEDNGVRQYLCTCSYVYIYVGPRHWNDLIMIRPASWERAPPPLEHLRKDRRALMMCPAEPPLV